MENCILFILLGINTWVDIKCQRIALKITLLAGIIGILWKLGSCGFWNPWWFGMAPGIFLLMISKITDQRLGMGDGILMLVVGIYLGLEGTGEMLLWSLFLAALWSVILLIFLGKKKEYAFPFVPFLMLAYVGRWLL